MLKTNLLRWLRNLKMMNPVVLPVVWAFSYLNCPLKVVVALKMSTKKTQCSVIAYLYEPEDSGSKSEMGESSFVSLIAKHPFLASTLATLQYPVTPAFLSCQSLIIPITLGTRYVYFFVQFCTWQVWVVCNQTIAKDSITGLLAVFFREGIIYSTELL